MTREVKNSAAVSVIIPCYECSLTIERAIESVLSQTLQPEEVILIDDASDDGTLKLLNMIETQYENWVKVIALNENVGAANARNLGWERASQPYIAFLDADDAWHPRKIETQYECMSANPDGALSGHGYVEFTDNDVGFETLPAEMIEVKKITFQSLLLKNQFVTPSVMLKRDLAFRFQQGKRYMEDHLLWLEIASDDRKVIKLNSVLVAVFKPMFGASGLSSNLYKMERAELSNYYFLYQQQNFSIVKLVMLQVYSLMKFVRRLFIVYVLRYWKR